jgi:hypothetical protein
MSSPNRRALIDEASRLSLPPSTWFRLLNRAARRDPERLRRASEALAAILSAHRTPSARPSA